LQRDPRGPRGRIGRATLLPRYSSAHGSQKVWVWSAIPGAVAHARRWCVDFLALEGAAEASGTAKRHFVLEKPHIEWLPKLLAEGKKTKKRNVHQLSLNTDMANRYREQKVRPRVEFVAAREAQSEDALRLWFEERCAGKYPPLRTSVEARLCPQGVFRGPKKHQEPGLNHPTEKQPRPRHN